MSRFLPSSLLLGLVASLVLAAACSDDPETVPPTTASTTTTTTSSGGATTTSTTTVGGGGAGGTAGAGPGGGGSGGMQMACMGPESGEDLCNGEQVVLSLGTQVELCGDTSLANDDYAYPVSPCAGLGSDGPDKVYEIVVQDPGTLRLQVRQDVGSGLNPTIHVRSASFGSMICDATDNLYGCWGFFGTHEEFAFDNFPETFWLIVDGANGTSGKYALDIALTSPACGDGVTNEFSANEECDDGNTVNGDGCSATCALENVTLFDMCPGEPVLLPPNSPQAFTSNTTGLSDTYQPPMMGCGFVPETGGFDRVYNVTAQADGMLTATIGLDSTCTIDICETEGLLNPGCWNYVLWATDAAGCGDAASTLACGNQKVYGPETISLPVSQGETYSIMVDGQGTAFPGAPTYGPYTLCLTLTP